MQDDYRSILDQFLTMDENTQRSESRGASGTAESNTPHREEADLFPFASESRHETTRTDKTPPFFSRKQSNHNKPRNRAPHQGSLYRIEASPTSESALSYRYAMEIALENGDSHELRFDPQHYEFMSRLFSILDTESRGLVGRTSLMEFVTLRCPVFWRRDEDLRKLHAAGTNDGSSPTFDEVWSAVSQCSSTPVDAAAACELGVEGWMVFCRFIALAQYLEAKRQFSARHLQQTMRHRNSPRGSELVMVDVPPPAAPAPLSPAQLAEYEQKGKAALPLPELDLDHSLVAAHDAFRRRTMPHGCTGLVKISLFGNKSTDSSSSSGSVSSSSPAMEFAVTYSPKSCLEEGAVVRRSFEDMKWLNDTFTSHTVMGGTLCGRILPPFPGSSVLASQYQRDDRKLKAAIGGPSGARAAATAGVNLLTRSAKSIWGSVSKKKSSEQKKGSTGEAKGKSGKTKISSSLALPESYYNPNSPIWKARQLERYLNYLLEHPALSTSFPLNTVLKASQSGLEAAKVCLEDHAKAAKKMKSYLPQLVDGKLSIPFWSHPMGSTPQAPPNLSWVRTAAQAAMALKVHGILETSGLPSASARLQHASLPSFEQSRSTGWADEDHHVVPPDQLLDRVIPSDVGEVDGQENFEQGVIHVDSELNVGEDDGFESSNDQDGYDLLPLPVPAPERRILCAGSQTVERTNDPFASLPAVDETRQARFHYGTPRNLERFDSNDSSQVQSAFLGEFSVDNNIDKLREVIGSVENTLTRCLSSSAGIGGARRERLALHLDVVKGFDSWQGMRGQFITQRALLRGVAGLDQSKDVSEEGDLDIIDDISWQTALARSAVSAAEDVRSTVRAARTAANAKAAADSAAFAAQNACDAGNFPTIDEARAAQTRSSIAQSHAIHAAVVEHEANTAKRRAALALAHDVKCWNVHRKRELLRTCLAYARSQHVASRRAVDAWSCLRDGYVGSTTVPFTETRRVRTQAPEVPPEPEATTVIFHEATTTAPAAIPEEEEEVTSDAKITAVEHDLLVTPPVFEEFDGLSKPSSTTDVFEEFDALNKPEGVPIVDAAPVSADEDDFGFPEDTEDQQDAGDLSASMQSLVDGLMNWGGQHASEEDFALPRGVAASIVMEENAAFGAHN